MLIKLLKTLLPYKAVCLCFASAGAESASAGDAPADSEHLMEDGEEGEDADAQETISKEEAAERLLVGSHMNLLTLGSCDGPPL